MGFIPPKLSAINNASLGAKNASNSSAPSNNKNSLVVPPGSQDQIQKLQSYVPGKQKVPVKYTRPGYELLIYSRFAEDTKLDLYSNLINFTGYSTTDKVPNAGSSTNVINDTICRPTFKFSSDTLNGTNQQVAIGHNQTPVITKVSGHQITDNATGSVGAVQLIQPQGVEFFNPTIGFAPPNYPDIDYHASIPNTDGPLRVGVMDTVLLRMSNDLMGPDGTVTRITETIFRGVIGEIRRTKSAKEGSLINLQLMDFSEFLRAITGIGLNLFSTTNFNITGRGYISKLLEYSNGLYSGNHNIVNVTDDTADKIGQTLESGLLDLVSEVIPSTGPLSLPGNSNRSNANHKMSLPPFFWLQYSPQDKISVDNKVASNNFGTTNPQNTAQAVATSVGDEFKDLINQAKQTITTDLNAIKSGQASSLLTPEDQESIRTYNIFGGTVPQNIQQSVSSLFQKYNVTLPSGPQLSEIAWALSDLYLEKGIISFAQEILWQSLYQIAQRTLRECYFDFSPKLRVLNDNHNPKGALVPFDTASVPEILAAGNQGLPDIHPNIGILKYRLSPCFIPYPPNGVNGASQFRFYSFSDDDIIESDFSETEQDVFTACFGFGNDIGKTSFLDTIKSLLDGQSQGLIANAETLDTRIESRLGYRFKTNHDETIRIPILMYITSYSLLHKSQANMFQQTLTIPGDPRVQPGSIVQIKSQNADFYCTQVLHTWDITGGYTSQLQLQFGHTTGTLPTIINAYGVIEDANTSVQNACTLSQMQMQKEGLTGHPPIGSINQDCLIYALQQYMTGVTISNNNPTIGVSPTNWYGNNSGKLSQPQIQALFESACTGNYTQYKQYSQIMSWIALGETNGETKYITLANPDGTNPTIAPDYSGDFQYSYGLWQVTPGAGVQGQPSTWPTYPPEDLTPLGNARIAVQRLAEQLPLFKPWGLTGLNVSDPAAAFQQIDSRYQPSGRISQLLGGTPNLSNSNLSATNLAKWPYDVYGPIGMQITSYSKISPMGSSDPKTYENQLKDSTTGLKFAQEYIKALSVKYAQTNENFTPYASSGADFSSINQSDKLSKVIAAWFLDDGSANLSKYNPGFMNEVIAQVRTLYQTCTTCLASEPQPFNAASASEMGLTATPADRQALVNSGHIKCTYAAVESDLLDPNKTSGDLILGLSSLVNHGGYYIGLTAINTGHGPDGTGPDTHAGGYAVDCWPYTDSTMTTYVSENPAITPNLIQFLKDVNALPTVLQIGLAGSARNYPENYVAAGSPSGQPQGYLQSKVPFEDNGQDHIHVGFK
jgi:hypothetical protein